MVRKRKTSGKPASKVAGKARAVDPKDASVKKWNKREDIPQDEEDLCEYISLVLLQCFTKAFLAVHAGRDEILLDGTDARRDADEFEDNEEEVFALRGLPDSDDEDEDENDEDVEDDDEDEDGEEEAASRTTTKKSKAKSSTAKSATKTSDDEGDESDESEERWGKNKSAYYSSNAKDIDSDDEETRDMEEAEARRLQAKARETITEDDFGLDEVQTPAQDERFVSELA